MTNIKILILLLLLSIQSCSNDWSSSTQNYTCSEQQMARVEKEMLFCTKETSYVKSYCYATAISRNCQLKLKVKSND